MVDGPMLSHSKKYVDSLALVPPRRGLLLLSAAESKNLSLAMLPQLEQFAHRPSTDAEVRSLGFFCHDVVQYWAAADGDAWPRWMGRASAVSTAGRYTNMYCVGSRRCCGHCCVRFGWHTEKHYIVVHQPCHTCMQGRVVQSCSGLWVSSRKMTVFGRALRLCVCVFSDWPC